MTREEKKQKGIEEAGKVFEQLKDLMKERQIDGVWCYIGVKGIRHKA